MNEFVWDEKWFAGNDGDEDIDLRREGSLVAWVRRSPEYEGYQIHTQNNNLSGEHFIGTLEEAKAYALLLVRFK